MWVKLIERDKLAGVYDEREQNRMKGEFARQTGAPYGMYRETIFVADARIAMHAATVRDGSGRRSL